MKKRSLPKKLFQINLWNYFRKVLWGEAHREGVAEPNAMTVFHYKVGRIIPKSKGKSY